MWNSLGFRLRRYHAVLYFVTILLFLSIGGCSAKSDNDKIDVINSSGVAIPNSIQALALPADTSSFTASLFLDDATTNPLASATIATDGNQSVVSFSNIDVPVGTHRFTITFVLETASYKVTLASAKSDSLNITAGSSQAINFDTNNYNFDYDLDGDRVSNFDEITASSPPNNDVCVLGVSLVGYCRIGGA